MNKAFHMSLKRFIILIILIYTLYIWYYHMPVNVGNGKSFEFLKNQISQKADQERIIFMNNMDKILEKYYSINSEFFFNILPDHKHIYKIAEKMYYKPFNENISINNINKSITSSLYLDDQSLITIPKFFKNDDCHIHCSLSSLENINMLTMMCTIKYLTISVDNTSESLFINDNLSLISKFTKLEKLTLYNCGNINFDILKKLEKLEIINIYGGKVYNLGDVKKLKKLKEIRLYKSNIVGNISLDGNSKLSIILELNSITDLSQIIYCNASLVSLKNNNISSITSLEPVINCNTLDLSENIIQSLDIKKEINTIKNIDISFNQLQSLEYLDKLNIKNAVYVKCNNITKLCSNKCYSIKELFLCDNKIKDLKNINNFKNVEILCLCHNYVNDLHHLAELKCLAVLNVSDNPINNYSVLSKIKSLKKLIVSDKDYEKAKREIETRLDVQIIKASNFDSNHSLF